MKLCYKIAKLRKTRGLSQEQLANELDVSRQSVFKWESGENYPDLEKIKKLAKLFNISLDLLLDDDKEIIEPIIEEKKSDFQKKDNDCSVKFRKTFDSGIRINSQEQADFEHGFCDKKKIAGTSFSGNTAKHKQIIGKKAYSKTIRIQHDVLLDFYVDDKNKSFGFFFDGAPQFVCPFENFATFSMSSSGLHTGYTKSPVVAAGVGSNPSIGIGSMPISRTRQPLRYDVAISYFDENGNLKDYKIAFGCNRMYIVHDGTARSVNELYVWEDLLSQQTNKALNEVAAYLHGIKEAGAQIKYGTIVPDILNFSQIEAEVKEGQEKKKTSIIHYKAEVEASNKRKAKGILIAFLIITIIVIVIIIATSISNSVKERRTEQYNKNKAYNVIEMIDDLGEISLASKKDIAAAESAYNALSSEQKRLVTNYYQLTLARSVYNGLLSKQEKETKDDPTRTIVLSDLNGRWESAHYKWAIADIGGGKSVLYWIDGEYNSSMFTSVNGNSALKGYNNETERMEIRLYRYNGISNEYLDVTMTKSESNVLTLYFGKEVFQKTDD